MRIVPGYWAHNILLEASGRQEGVRAADFAHEGYTSPLPSVYTNLAKLTKAGLLRKEGRVYFITEKGAAGLAKLPDPADMYEVTEIDRWPFKWHTRKRQTIVEI